MANKEKTLPLSTIGGRMQHLRRLKKLEREDFYLLVYPMDKDSLHGVTPETMKDKIRDWESGNRQPTFEEWGKICEILDCTYDYLLGTEGKRIKSFLDMTGLSEKSIRILSEWNSNPLDMPGLSEKFLRILIKLNFSPLIFVLNKLIESGNAFSGILASIWNYSVESSEKNNTEKKNGNLSSDNDIHVVQVNTGFPSRKELLFMTVQNRLRDCLKSLFG